MGRTETRGPGAMAYVSGNQSILVPVSSELWGLGGASRPDLSSPVPLRPLCERRKLLHDNMVEIPNRIMFSEMKQVTVSEDPTFGRAECPMGRTRCGEWAVVTLLRGRLMWIRADLGDTVGLVLDHHTKAVSQKISHLTYEFPIHRKDTLTL